MNLSMMLAEDDRPDDGADDGDYPSGVPYTWEREQGRSKLRKPSFLHDCAGVTTETIANYVRACGALRAIAGISIRKPIMRLLAEYTSHSLESVAF